MHGDSWPGRPTWITRNETYGKAGRHPLEGAFVRPFRRRGHESWWITRTEVVEGRVKRQSPAKRPWAFPTLGKETRNNKRTEQAHCRNAASKKAEGSKSDFVPEGRSIRGASTLRMTRPRSECERHGTRSYRQDAGQRFGAARSGFEGKGGVAKRAALQKQLGPAGKPRLLVVVKETGCGSSGRPMFVQSCARAGWSVVVGTVRRIAMGKRGLFARSARKVRIAFRGRCVVF